MCTRNIVRELSPAFTYPCFPRRLGSCLEEKEKEDARKRVTDEERELIVKLYVQRYSTPEIARMSGRKQATVRKVIRRHLEGGAI